MPVTDAKTVILEILRQAEGEWTGRIKFHKAFYFAHLYYALDRPGRLTDWPIARMPQGPGIHDSGRLFAELVRDGLVEEERIHEGPYPEYRYRVTPKGRQLPAPREDAVRAIEKAVLFCKDKSATELTQITHDRSRCWNAGKDGDILDIDIDLIPEDEYAKREEELRHVDGVLANLFPEAGSTRGTSSVYGRS
jgi:hypothetical protein